MKDDVSSYPTAGDLGFALQSADFQQELRALHHLRTFTVLAVSLGLLFSFYLFEHLLLGKKCSLCLVYHFSATGVILLLLLANHLDREGSFALPIGLAGYLCVIGAALLSLQHQAVGGPHYASLIVVQVLYTSLAPLTAVQTMGCGLLPALAYLSLALVRQDADQEHLADVFSNTFFMLSFVLVSCMQSWVETKSRLREHLLREDEKQAGERLAAQARKLEQEAQLRLVQQQALEEHYQILYESMADALVLVASDGRILQANAVYVRNFCGGALSGQASLLDLAAEQDHPRLRSHLLEPIQKNVVTVWQGVLTSSQGQKIDVEISGALLQRGSEEIGLQLVIRDIGTRRALEKKMADSLAKVRQMENMTILALAKILEYRDVSPGNHLERVREYCRLLAEGLARCPGLGEQVSPAYVQMLCQGSVLHDIGKVALPDEILSNKGSLSKHEEQLLRQHTVKGGELIRKMEEDAPESGFLSLARNIACFHHEHWDGSGYPYGLREEDIPLEARIVTLADAYEGMTSGPAPVAHQQAVSHILEEAGQVFDPLLVEVFLLRQGEFEQACRRFEEKA